MKKFFLLLAALFFANSPAHAEGPLPVVASFSILGDMVKQIGGPDVQVTTIVGPNSDTHVYEPTPNDAKSLANAKLLFVNGLGFEGWIPRLAEAANFKGKTVTVSNSIKPRTMMDDGKEIIDPHAWQDLSNGIVYAHNIVAALQAALPEKSTDIQLRANAYISQMKAINQNTKTEIAAVPESKRRIITSHDAFGYFGAAYGVEFLAPVGVSTEAEPSAAEVAKLIQQIRQQGIKTIFLENMASPRLAQQLSKESGAKLGAELYSDALSESNGPAPTYLAMFEHNVSKLKAAMLENDPR
jgi:zinc/manganese transport system substrate-binding protein